MILSALGGSVGSGIAPLQLGQHVHAFDDPTKHRMPAVKMGRGHECQEELRSAGVLAGMGHADRAAESDRDDRPASIRKRSCSLVRRCPPPCGSPPWAMKPLQDAVERVCRCTSCFHQADEVGDRVGRLVLEQFDDDVPFAGLQLHWRQIVGLRLGRAELGSPWPISSDSRYLAKELFAGAILQELWRPGRS